MSLAFQLPGNPDVSGCSWGRQQAQPLGGMSPPRKPHCGSWELPQDFLSAVVQAPGSSQVWGASHLVHELQSPFTEGTGVFDLRLLGSKFGVTRAKVVIVPARVLRPQFPPPRGQGVSSTWGDHCTTPCRSSAPGR